MQHRFKLCVARGTQHGHIGNRAEIADVKYAVMSFPVAADKSGSVNAEYNMQILQRDIVNEHIIAALEEA